MSIVLEAAAGAALSAFFGVLFDKLSSPDLLKIFRQENVDADLKKWKTILLEISEVLDDAEEKQITKVSVKNWMAELEGLAYDADDILDEFATEALRRMVNAEEPSTSKIRKFIPVCCVGLNPSSMFDANMRSKIKEINEKLQEFVTRKNDLKLEDFARGRTRTITSRVPATSLVESHTYGREKDKEAIVELLTGGSGGAQLSTISILGMGGLGKTTLAKLVYNDDKVGSYFNVKAWVCVSQNFDILRVTKEILQDITSKTCKDDSLNLVQRKLEEQLSGKKFLLILDDVWNENYTDWTELRLPFQSGAHGSKILITTREANVSSIMGAPHPYQLRALSNNACLTMFTQHALGTSNFDEHLKDEERQKILERCKGLPLAAKALAGLLLRYDRDDWKDVLNGRIWDLLEEKNDVPSTLRLSYLYLPSSLKKCFAYCSLFPKDYHFEEKELVLLWMAEGLVRETREKSMEDLGGEYFRDLLKRSFFQRSSLYSHRSLFLMHDLMHDLAQWAAGDFYRRLEDQLGGSKISTKVRHFSYIEHSHDCIQKFDEDVHLRTFLSLPLYNIYGLTNFDVKYCLFPQLRCLRVLSLSGKDIFELPSSIGDLKHLRYLNLSYTKITILPESTSSLYNLQTLILKGCDSLTKLPEKIENLVNLRHLNISSANSIREMPAEIAKLKSLQTLCFKGMHGWQNWIPCRVECEEFPNLRELSISDCPKLEGKFPHHLPSLEKLFIYECEHLVVSIPSLPMLQELEIVRCKDVVVDGFVKAEKLKIEYCQEVKSLSLLALEIIIESCQSLVNIKLKSTLRTLTIKDCKALESLQFVMDEGEEFSCLRELSISHCSKLKGKFPNHLPSLEKLSICACERLVVSIPSHSVLQELIISGCKEVVHGYVKVEKLIIANCKELTSLCEDGLMSFVALEIIIVSCQSLVNIKLKSTLRTLTIRKCSALESLEFVMDEGGASSTSSLLMNEENLSCFGNNNASLLEHLEISDCPSLKCVSTIVDLATMLKRLDINLCPNLTSLGDTLNKDTLLEELYIFSCENLRCLPNNIHNLNFLQDLTIGECPSIVSFPEEGFPTNLRKLRLLGANLCEQVFELALHRLTLLRDLWIGNGIMDSFPEEEDGKTMLMLPTSLTTLIFINFPNLLFLSGKFFQNLSALEEISISKCPKLASLPEECFPPSLQKLSIFYCPVLKQNYEKDGGIMWSKIANIPLVLIDCEQQ